MDIGEKQLLKEVVANVKNARATPEELSAELLGVIKIVSETSDISLAKLVHETNKDTELSMIRQAIIDKEFDHIPTHYRIKKNDLSAEMGLVIYKNKIVIPNRMQEWILQVAHGDHESSDKMEELCERVHWETKDKDITEKANNCLTCFRTGKNLKCMLPKTEINQLPKGEKVGDEVQIDFAGPFFDEKGKKRFIALAIDICTRWPIATVCKKCDAESALEILAMVCENIGLPRKLKLDNATAFKSRKFQKVINDFGISTEFSTPYVHTPIAIVERDIRTLESYIKPFLLENNTLKQAVRRAIKLMRFSESVPLKKSPFEKLTGCKPRNRITNNLG